MKSKLKFMAFGLLLSFAGGLLGGCWLDGGDDSNNPPPPPPPPPPPSAVVFSDFVKDLLTQPGTATPVQVNGVDFTFPDLDNPDAFDDVLPPPDDSGGR
ncbi:MAG: hypothetical protein L0I62_04030 [Gammaproteobacteria bacterium]|nr:hypothetical protein [Gammaproteobacteria bacterium]